MAVVECLAKLVATGQITKQAGAEARATYERMKGQYSRHMGPADAEAAAGLVAARAMDAGAKKLKNDAAKQTLGFINFERTALEHPDGIVAGVMDQLASSLRGRGTRNVDSVREDIWNQQATMLGDTMKDFRPGVTGTSAQQIASSKNLIRELFGVSTGDAVAAKAAQAVTKTIDWSAARAQAAGKNFSLNENWRIFQSWVSEQVSNTPKAEWINDWNEQIAKNGVTLWETRADGGARPALPEEHTFILERAYDDIKGSGGGVGMFPNEHRTFEFAQGEAGADAYLAMQGKYGAGDNVFGMITGHLGKMASEIALMEVIAPNHGAVIKAMLPRLKAADLPAGDWRRLNPMRWLESPHMVQKTYDVLTGRANVVEGATMAGILGGIRSISTAAQLKGAVISAVPGDTVTTLLAGNYNGIPATRLVSGVIRELSRGGEESRALAARLELVSHSAMEYGHGYRFFQDQIAGPSQLRWLATTMIRAQGLQAWTEMMKRTFSMEFMGHLSDHAAHSLDELRNVNAPLARFLDRYQISAADWDKVRASQPLEVGGTRFLDTEAIGDQALAEKVRTAILQERRFAVLEPDARVRAITTGGLPQGTFMGEVARSLFLFKSFSMTMASTHIMRIFSQETWGEMAKLGLPFVLLSAVAGAASMQAKNIVYGKDPEEMGTATFWGKAFLQGGGLGLYGDMLNSAFARTGRSFVAEFAGPVAGIGEDVFKLSSGQLRKFYEGSDTTFGAEATRVAKRYTPGTFYTKLAVDRLIWDQLQTMVDPDYRGSFRRMEKRMRDDTGQEFWFSPGQTTPSRAPNLGAAIP